MPVSSTYKRPLRLRTKRSSDRVVSEEASNVKIAKIAKVVKVVKIVPTEKPMSIEDLFEEMLSGLVV